MRLPLRHSSIAFVGVDQSIRCDEQTGMLAFNARSSGYRSARRRTRRLGAHAARQLEREQPSPHLPGRPPFQHRRHRPWRPWRRHRDGATGLEVLSRSHAFRGHARRCVGLQAPRIAASRIRLLDRTMNSRAVFGSCFALIAAAWLLVGSGDALGAGDPARGATLFQACLACHSTAPGEHLTGPSLANMWQRKAGTVPGFSRYSDAMKRTDLVWREEALDQWLTDPEALIPGTSMTFPGLRENNARQDVIAYLKAVSEGKALAPARGG